MATFPLFSNPIEGAAAIITMVQRAKTMQIHTNFEDADAKFICAAFDAQNQTTAAVASHPTANVLK